MLKYGYSIKDVGHSLSWSALRSFIANISTESALTKEIQPDVYEWSTRLKTNVILADIFDVLAMINANLVALGSHSRAKTPKPYPRPKQDDDSRYGGDAMPISELRDFFANKRKGKR